MINSPNSQTGKAEAEQNSAPEKSRVSRIVWSISEKVLLLILLALAVNYFLPKISSIENSLKVFSSLRNWALILAFGSQLLSYYGSGITISKCVKLSGKNVSVTRGMLIYIASTSIGLVAGGMFGSTASIFRWIKASGGDNESSSLAASLPPIFIDIVLIFISFIGLIFLLFIHDISKTQTIFFFLIAFLLLAFCFLFIYAVRHKEKSTEIIVASTAAVYKLFKKNFSQEIITENVIHLFSTWDYLIKGGWKGPLLGSTLNILFDILTLFFVFLAAGTTISPVLLIAGYGLPWLFGRMAFIVPGGVGVIESTMVAMYTSFGIENSLATVVVLIYRVISFWIPSIAGFIILPFLNRISKDR